MLSSLLPGLREVRAPLAAGFVWLVTKNGRAAYARRKVIVEPVFGQMATLQNAKQLLLRGLDGAQGEWLLLAACHNLRKLHGHIGLAGLATT